MKKTIILTTLITTSALFTGCATLLGGGGTQTLNINSNAPVKGTIEYADGGGVQYFTAPATLNVERKSKSIIVKSQDNEFAPKTVPSGINPWFLGNLIFGGLVGSTTDSISGAAWKYDETVSISAQSAPTINKVNTQAAPQKNNSTNDFY